MTPTIALPARVLPALAALVATVTHGLTAGALLLAAPTTALAQQTQQICSGQPIPTGWVHTNTTTSYQCPAFNSRNPLPNGTLILTNTAGLTGQLQICSDQTELPENWLWVRSTDSGSVCAQAIGSQGTSTRWKNIKVIENVSRTTELYACTDQPAQSSGWDVFPINSTDHTCMPPSVSSTTTAPIQGRALWRRRCTVSSTGYVGPGQAYSYTIAGATIPFGSQGHWYGTRNNVVDATGFNFGTVPTTMPYVNQPGWEGQYTRYAEVFTPQNTLFCRTNTVDQTLAVTVPPPPPPPVCTLSVSGTTVGPNQAYAFYATVQGNLPAGSQA
ncbi:MAG: hypothetical protein H7Y33_01545, partial [Cytophagales bacterium]|nr:hypothetical protein [Rhizobacter sp.]